MTDQIARVGEWIRFEYPENNREGVPLVWRPRVMRIDLIDDAPVPQAFVDRDPLLRRYGPRLIGPDFARKGEVRSFYLHAARGIVRFRAFGASTPLEISTKDIRKDGATSKGLSISGSVNDAGRRSGAKGLRGMDRDRLFRIVVSDGDSEEIAEPCLRERKADAFIRGFNAVSDVTGWSARAQEVESPRLKGDLPGQVQ